MMTELRPRKRVMRVISAALIVAASIASLFALAWLQEHSAHPDSAYLVLEFNAANDGQVTQAPLRNGYYDTSSLHVDVVVFEHHISTRVRQLQQPAILVAAVTREAKLNYCGADLRSDLARGSPSRFKGFEPYYFDLPARDCPDGILQIAVAGKQDHPTLRRVYIGEAEDIARAYRWRQFWGVDTVIAATGVAGLAALVAFAALPLAGRRFLYVSFGVMMTFWAARNLYYLGPVSEFSPRAADVWFYGSTLGLMAASLAFVNEWTMESRLVKRWVLPGLAIAFVLTVMAIALGQGSMPGLAARASYVLGLICMALFVGQMVFALQQERSPPYPETFLFLFGALGGLLDLVGSIWLGFGPAVFGEAGQTMPHAPHMPIFAAIAMVLVVARQNQYVQHQLSTANENLAERLNERETKLKRVYQLRQEEERERLQFKERQRIMNDVHDGFGGRLLALLLRAENGELNREGVTNGLRDSLQDLRLIVDSMDTADGDLELAFGALRGRIEPQLQAANLELDWKVELGDARHDLGTTQILSIYRMIQEATTNSVRHAQAQLVTIGVGWRDDGLIKITVSDDGKGDGSKKDHQVGRGLTNITNRAIELGGEANFASTPDGFAVTIIVPARKGDA